MYYLLFSAYHNNGQQRKTYKTAPDKKALGADANVSKLLSAASGNGFMLLHERKERGRRKCGGFFNNKLHI